MKKLLYLEDSYRTEASATVVGITAEGGIMLDKSLFYPTSGGQPGDSGHLTWAEGEVIVETARKMDYCTVMLIPAGGQTLPFKGTELIQSIDWDKRYRHMQMHTALHLLSVVIPLPVTGGAITAEKSRLDFDMPEPLGEKGEISEKLNALIQRDLMIGETWISEEELNDNPSLIKTLSVKPPKGAGHIRLVSIGEGVAQIDLQPCGGTHVKRTMEIGRLRISKIEKKGRQNRRVHVVFE